MTELMYIYVAGIGAILGSWLSSLANALGIVLEGVSTTLVTPAPGQPVQPSNNAVLEPSSDVTKTVVANGRCAHTLCSMKDFSIIFCCLGLCGGVGWGGAGTLSHHGRHAVAYWLGHYAASRKVAGSKPDKVN
jgi:hypothetical protein